MLEREALLFNKY